MTKHQPAQAQCMITCLAAAKLFHAAAKSPSLAPHRPSWCIPQVGKVIVLEVDRHKNAQPSGHHEDGSQRVEDGEVQVIVCSEESAVVGRVAGWECAFCGARNENSIQRHRRRSPQQCPPRLKQRQGAARAGAGRDAVMSTVSHAAGAPLTSVDEACALGEPACATGCVCASGVCGNRD